MIEDAHITTLTAANDTPDDTRCTMAIHGLIGLLARAELRKVSGQAANSNTALKAEISR